MTLPGTRIPITKSNQSSKGSSGLLQALSKPGQRTRRLLAYKELPCLAQELRPEPGELSCVENGSHQPVSIVLYFLLFLSFCSTDFEPCLYISGDQITSSKMPPLLVLFTSTLLLRCCLWGGGKARVGVVQTGPTLNIGRVRIVSLQS